MTNPSFYMHPGAEVSPDAHVGAGTRIWRQVQVREHAHIGETCTIGKGVYVDAHVKVLHSKMVFLLVPTYVSPTTSCLAPLLPTANSRAPMIGRLRRHW